MKNNKPSDKEPRLVKVGKRLVILSPQEPELKPPGFWRRLWNDEKFTGIFIGVSVSVALSFIAFIGLYLAGLVAYLSRLIPWW